MSNLGDFEKNNDIPIVVGQVLSSMHRTYTVGPAEIFATFAEADTMLCLSNLCRVYYTGVTLTISVDACGNRKDNVIGTGQIVYQTETGEAIIIDIIAS